MSLLHVRMLERAADALGGFDEVARYLAVSEVRLRFWMRGGVAPPDDVFLKLVDLLSEPPGARAATRRGPAAGAK